MKMNKIMAFLITNPENPSVPNAICCISSDNGVLIAISAICYLAKKYISPHKERPSLKFQIYTCLTKNIFSASVTGLN